jgi:hypothetical protein
MLQKVLARDDAAPLSIDPLIAIESEAQSNRFAILTSLVVLSLIGTLFSISSWPDSHHYMTLSYVWLAVYVLGLFLWYRAILSTTNAATFVATCHCVLMISGAAMCGREHAQFALLNYYALPFVLMINATILPFRWMSSLFVIVLLAITLFGQGILVPAQPLFCFECMERQSYFLQLGVSCGCLVVFLTYHNNVTTLNQLLKESYEQNGNVQK